MLRGTQPSQQTKASALVIYRPLLEMFLCVYLHEQQTRLRNVEFIWNCAYFQNVSTGSDRMRALSKVTSAEWIQVPTSVHESTLPQSGGIILGSGCPVGQKQQHQKAAWGKHFPLCSSSVCAGLWLWAPACSGVVWIPFDPSLWVLLPGPLSLYLGSSPFSD